MYVPNVLLSRLRGCPDDASPLLSQLTPAQLEEFESTFRHFDVDGNNTLAIEEFEAALAALSISFSVRPSFLIDPNSVEKLTCLRTPSHQTAEIDNIFDELVETFGALNFKAFTSFLVEIIQDTDSPQQLQNAFREIAGNKVRRRHSLCKNQGGGLYPELLSFEKQPYVTELDLQVAQVPKSSIDFFKCVYLDFLQLCPALECT
jgi:Ca2+-binding EF-hand superfamily protein